MAIAVLFRRRQCSHTDAIFPRHVRSAERAELSNGAASCLAGALLERDSYATR